MKKLKFSMQVMVLLLAFPTWFYAEMKHADRSVINSQKIHQDSVQVKKAAAEKKQPVDSEITTGITADHAIVCN